MTRSLVILTLFAAAATAGAQSAPPMSAMHGAVSKAHDIASGAAAHNADIQAAGSTQPTTGSTTTKTTTTKAPAIATKPAPATTRTSTTGAGATAPATAAIPDTSMVIKREVFTYNADNRRDPFVSLMTTGELRPALQDLLITGIAYDPTGRNSVAVMRDVSTNDQYRVKVGQVIGRMRIAQIQPKEVVFTIEELGFSRQETLALGDTTRVRKK